MTTLRPPAGTAQLLQLADSIGCAPTTQTLVSLTLAPGDPELIGGVAAFLSKPNIQLLLHEWGQDDDQSDQLSRLSSAIWSRQDLLDAMPTVDAAHLVSRELRGKIGAYPLAAMLAARTAYSPSDPELAETVEALRLWTLCQSIRAARQNIWAEANIHVIADVLRQCCDRTDSPKLALIRRLELISSSFGQMTRDIHFSCKQAMNAGVEAGDRNFYRALESICTGNWRASSAHTGQVVPDQAALPLPGERSSINEALDAAELSESGHVVIADPAGETATSVAVVEPTHPTARSARRVEGVVLQSIEEVQFLPWSWHRLHASERDALLAHLSHVLDHGKQERDRVGAALMTIALIAARSASGVQAMTISFASQDDWSLNLKDGTLHRRPPRPSRRWRADTCLAALAHDTTQRAEVQTWLREQVPNLEIQLRQRVTSPLRAAAARMSERPSTLLAIWKHVGEQESLHQWFGANIAEDKVLERLSATSLSSVTAQSAYADTTDHVLARLIQSSPRTGLPADCAYASFPWNSVRPNALPGWARPFATWVTDAAANANVAGSELEIDDEYLRRHFAATLKRLDETANIPERWCDHHNHLTCYVVACLLAATGVRPVSSPFESLAWFDFDEGLLYIEDKRTGPTDGRRLLILPGSVQTLVREVYLPHLGRVADLLSRPAPELSRAVHAVTERDPNAPLPLFFLLRERPRLEWAEITETQLDLHLALPGRLPWNLFRHRLATQLRRGNLDPEIIDAILGHADAGAESHGDYSHRTLITDLEASRPHIERLTQALGLALPCQARYPDRIKGQTENYAENPHTRKFGRARREAARAENLQAARRQAHEEIQAAIAARPVATLSPQEWETIANKMLLRTDGLPHSMASVRYEVFEQFHRQRWEDSGLLPRMRTWRVPHPPSKAAVTERAIGCRRSFEQARTSFTSCCSSIDPRSLNSTAASTLIALALCLETGITDLELLAEAATRPRLQVVKVSDKWYVEHRKAEEWEDGAPVRRFRVSLWMTTVLAYARPKKSINIKKTQVPALLSPLLSVLALPAEATIHELLTELSEVTEQVNLLQLPSVTAAYLAGRITPSALPHSDWMRLVQGRAPIATAAVPLPVDDGDVATTSGDDWIEPGAAEFVSRGASGRGPATASKDRPAPALRMRKLCAKIREALSSKDRIDTAKASIQAALKESGFTPGQFGHVFANWSIHLMSRPVKKAKAPAQQSSPKKLLGPRSVLRYFNALTPGISAIDPETQLFEADSDEVTDLLAGLLYGVELSTEAVAVDADKKPSEESSKANRKAAEAATESDQTVVNQDSSRDLNFVLAQIRDFHAYAAKHHDVETPDWSELDAGPQLMTGRPGTVTEEEYLVCLRHLVGVDGAPPESIQPLAEAFTLLLCYRFGLRITEAVGLQRRDWVESADTTVVLVRANAIRGLKRPASRRQVPLLERLEAIERSLVAEVLRRWELRDGVDGSSALLPGVVKGTIESVVDRIRSVLVPLLRGVTHSPRAVVHHLRHSFANRVLLNLEGMDAAGNALPDETTALHVRRLLTCKEVADRRTLWATARMLGHASPASSLKSYLHLIDSRAPFRELDELSCDLQLLATPYIDLDKIRTATGYPAAPKQSHLPVASHHNHRLRSVVQYMRLRSLGKTVHRSLKAALLDEATATSCELLLAQIDRATGTFYAPSGEQEDRSASHSRSAGARTKASLALAEPKPMPNSAASPPTDDGGLHLLRKIRPLRWPELIAMADRAHSNPALRWDGDLGTMFSPTRQILLYQKPHFAFIAEFLRSFGLFEEQLKLVRPKALWPTVERWIEEYQLAPWLVEAEKWRDGGLQLGTVAVGDPPMIAPHRVALIVDRSDRVGDNYELMVLVAAVLTCWGPRPADPRAGASSQS